jgi:hypothetical protein
VVTEQELESVEAQSTTILLTAFAILTSAMVEVQTVGLSNFHAAVVLDLSWMNNTNTFIYFLLYVQHKTQEGTVKPEWSAWIVHFRMRIVKAMKDFFDLLRAPSTHFFSDMTLYFNS